MEIEVKEASRRLGVNDSRVRKMLRSGSLRGRRVGTSWVVLVDDVARLENNPHRAGRPLAPRRAWAALDLLSSGRAPWLPDSARSQVRSHLARLNQPGADVWRSLLRSRSEVVHALAHPAALARLGGIDGVVAAGPDEAMRRGLDLVALEDGAPEFYVEASAWQQIAQALAIRRSVTESNVRIRVPRDVWPFADGAQAGAQAGAQVGAHLSDAALAADLLESGEPRAVSAGAGRLNDLLDVWQQQWARRASHRASRGDAQRQVREGREGARPGDRP